ncbi:MAG: leucine-rich repeat domain-containing protein [Treponema sp.]|jgi:hypothetical protein|nr:leucine-rich repeat domain-containing protein [Treponema sp.]
MMQSNKAARTVKAVCAIAVFFAALTGAPAHAADSDYEFDAATGTIAKYAGWDTELVIPAAIGGKPVTAIGNDAFKGADLTAVIIPGGVVTIGNSAFENNQLTALAIPKSVTIIGRSAFRNNKLSAIALEQGLRSIGELAFVGNQLTALVIPEGVTDLGSHAFSNNKLENVSLPASLLSVANDAFGNSNAGDYKPRLGNPGGEHQP